jgi:tetratricopeptide (TPR) repeat protein
MQPHPIHDEYVHRRQEEDIATLVERVRADGTSRAALLYGGGGVGKTRMVRALAEEPGAGRAGGADTVWVDPIDVDDSVYWLLSNLEREVARALDPDDRYFRSYVDYLSRLPRYTQPYVGHETVVSHLGRIKDEFIRCYRAYVTAEDKTVVITLDTVEAIRSTYLLLTLTQWMKALPRTLFILSGRSPDQPDQPDPIRDQLADPHRQLETTDVTMTGFDPAESMTFLRGSPLWPSLSGVERTTLVELTAGQPLWLAVAVDYLESSGPPAEMTGQHTDRAHLQAAFRRRLVSPYRSTGFWPEAIRRLAVVRHSVNEEVWRRLMDDRELPPGVRTWEQAWHDLLRLPWVRPRANRRYVTLHDAFAEELAQRLIPLHDQDGTWRRALWRRAADIYQAITAEPDRQVRAEMDRLSGPLREPDQGSDAELIGIVAALDERKRELDQLKTAQLHYRLLDDYAAGCDRFIELYGEAARQHDLLFQELLCHEFEHFLPHGRQPLYPASDALSGEIGRFRRWLIGQAPATYLRIGLLIARFLTQTEQPGPALALLSELPDEAADADLRYQLGNERGNACMRIPGQVAAAENHFRLALAETGGGDEPQWVRRRAQALKELGFYYRNLGRWDSADASYQQARNVISAVLGPGSSAADREEMASIQTNWAYLKALKGNYEEARNLVESAIRVRKRLSRLHVVGVSLSVYGEVLRYDRQFALAWSAYQEAEQIFEQRKSWPWLGQIYQEQAICLFQASQEGVTLVGDQESRSHELIRRALDICHDQSVRSYPSALNRAGRILGAGDLQAGLGYLEESIEEAIKVADGWFISANLMEYLDLSYRAWIETGDRSYRERIDARAADVRRAIQDYEFLDLKGRWALLQGHLAVRDAADAGTSGRYQAALAHYADGFVLLADRSVGSHGLAAIGREFSRFRDIFLTLPEEVQRDWYRELQARWSDLPSEEATTSLLARMQELY